MQYGEKHLSNLPLTVCYPSYVELIKNAYKNSTVIQDAIQDVENAQAVSEVPIISDIEQASIPEGGLAEREIATAKAQISVPLLREFLIDHFKDRELRDFCHDYFREVDEEFTNTMRKSDKVEYLIEYCKRHEKMPNLLAALAGIRQEQYETHFGKELLPQVLPQYFEPSTVSVPSGRDNKLIFISYAHEDSKDAHKLALDLNNNGWRIWIAPESIQPGEKWSGAINRGLEECGIFIVVLTKNSVTSSWVVDETNVAIDMEHHNHQLLFIPVEFESCNIPPLWKAYQSISFNDYKLGLILY